MGNKKGAVQVKKGKPVTKKTAVPGSADAAEAGAPVGNPGAVSAFRLAQIVNLHLSGVGLDEIGAAIGMSGEEVDSLLQTHASRYIRTQPALRTFVRNWVSSKYMDMMEANKDAFDENSPKKLETQDRVLRILSDMRKLHGTDAPVQSEIKVDAAPEAVEKLVQSIAAKQGLGYDMNIFDNDDDIVDAELVDAAQQQAHAALESASAAVEEPQDGDEEWE